MKSTLFEICFSHEELVWHFAVNPEGHLCYRSSPKDKKKWSEPFLLQKDYGGQFAATLGAEKRVHLVSTDKENTIWYHRYQQGQWHSSIIENVLPWPEVTNLRLAEDVLGRIHLLYCLQRKGETEKWQFIHQFREKEGWKSSVLDEGTGTGEASASAAIDSENNLHVIYSLPRENRCSLRYWVFSPSLGQWNVKEEIPSLPPENRYPCTVFDNRGSLHLVWAGSDGRNLRTLYTRFRKEPWPEGGWEQPRYLSLKGSNSYSPYIFTSDNKVIALWQQVDGVFYRMSSDLGRTWHPTRQYTELRNLEEYTLEHLDMENQEGGTLTIFSSSAPQVAFFAAATLLKEVEAEAEPVASQLPAKTDQSTGVIPSNAKRFLLGYSDTKLSNRIMNQTIDDKEQEILSLNRENQALREKIRLQIREVNLAKAMAEMHRKEETNLKAACQKLEGELRELEISCDTLSQEKSTAEARVRTLEREKQKLQKDLHRSEYENFQLVQRINIFEAEKENLLRNLKESQRREMKLEKSILQLQEEVTKLEAETNDLQQELLYLQRLIAASAIEQSLGKTGQNPVNPF